MGPKFPAKERKRLNLSRFYAIAQIEYCRNFIFKRHFPIHKLFERSCELVSGQTDRRQDRRNLRHPPQPAGCAASSLPSSTSIEHGHHAFRAYFKNAFLKQYEKFATFLRNELVSNNLADFQLRKGLDHLDAVRERFQVITSRFAGFQAQWLNVHVDFPLLQRLALPYHRQLGSLSRYQDPRHHASSVSLKFSCTAAPMSADGPPNRSTMPSSPPSIFPKKTMASTNSRYDLRKLKGTRAAAA